jgi:two-component system, OmpR family, response regulator
MYKMVLIIDDEKDFCVIMNSYLKRKGYEVQVASSLREGFEKLDTYRPDILFLDNNLPDGNGWDNVGHIVESFPHIKAYLISAHRNYSPLKESHSNIVVWEKPISMETLNKYF